VKYFHFEVPRLSNTGIILALNLTSW